MSRSTQVARRRAEQARGQHARIARELAQRRRRRTVVAGTAVGGVLLLFVVLVIVKVATPRDSGSAAGAASDASTVAAALAAVPPSILDSVGRGRTTSLPARASGQPALVVDGKPLVLYIGAEYCPFCAAQRWGLIVALSRFGTFSGLSTAHSASDDVYPSTATLSFHGARYTSQYLAFTGVELAGSERRGGSYPPLDSLTAEQAAVMSTYDAPPYVPASSKGAVPFVDFGNRFLMSGAAYSPALLAGLSHDRITAALTTSDNQVAQAVLGSANAFTAVLCELTNGQPASVCQGTAALAYSDLAHAAG